MGYGNGPENTQVYGREPIISYTFDEAIMIIEAMKQGEKREINLTSRPNDIELGQIRSIASIVSHKINKLVIIKN